MAERAIGAENPIVELNQPETNPSQPETKAIGLGIGTIEKQDLP